MFIFSLQLHSHNANVNAINNSFLAKLPGEEKVYTAVDSGQNPYKQNMNKYCIAMDTLVLKEKAQVMLLKNISEELINGSRGVVVGFENGVSVTLVHFRIVLQFPRTIT